MQSVYIYEQDFYNIESEYELKNKLYSLGVPFKNPITLELDDKFEYFRETVDGKDIGSHQDPLSRWVKFSWVMK